MFAHMQGAISAAERVAREGTVEDVIAELRALSLDDFGTVLFGMPDAAHPAMSRLLPRMADPDVQWSWTGNAGIPLLQQTLNFVRSVALQSVRLTGRPLQGRSILDFGCGYGRILRLMYYFSAPERTWGVDPWDRSIEFCREARLPSRLAMSDYLPRTLPVGGSRFGLIYAFSVFTHTSERATRQALSTLRDHVEQDGFCAITIRPREYWSLPTAAGHVVDADLMLSHHDARGFAFTPHERAPVEGDVTYGDTSMTLRWLGENSPGWEVAGYDHILDDPYQIIVYLRPV